MLLTRNPFTKNYKIRETVDASSFQDQAGRDFEQPVLIQSAHDGGLELDDL